MLKNVGAADRILRLVAAVVLAGIAGTRGGGWPVLGPVLWIVAAVLLLTAAFATCPAYRLFGLSTCPLQKK